MFVRKKKNRSGSTSIVIVDKRGGRFKELHTVGIANGDGDIAALMDKGRKWIDEYNGVRRIDFEGIDRKTAEISDAEHFLNNIDSVLLNGAKMILDKVYDSIGFNCITDNILRQLVIARLCQPMSKMATVEYLKSHFDEDVNLSKIYRYLDKLYNTQQDTVQRISVEHTFKVIGGRVEMLFYDVTSLYFESFREDVLRSPGFSKDGKTAETQIILGLLVCENGYPLAYSLFNGAQYESYTMIPVIDDFKQRFGIDDFIVVADSGFMIKRNIELLRSGGYDFIVGARIKKSAPQIKEWILSLPHEDGLCHETTLENGDRLIVTYSSRRAAKDEFNRRKGVERLRKSFASGKITKDKINKRGYNKFLKIDNDVAVSINEDKIAEDAKWDGMKGYVTNTSLTAPDVVAQYRGLWVVERAFRVSKGTIETRPIFHFTEKRIEAHVCLCFVAFKVYKELERILHTLGMGLSVDSVLKIAKTISTIRLKLPINDKIMTRTMILTPEHRSLQPLLDYLGV
ncbi:IS1634 family transposase [Lepagella muris]|jgi:transposase|uniref:IS1634 family transposase n=1 Tax=Lepagella muris TaxID=3032870 RepID=A0AC61RB90_9BACT|nr:IS1634 family transposase [Lepagella muris]ROT09337.1 IS1634 family transposase [Muribaculaceae bacterium Isolate-037 (Harlan)]TGY74824.1 IS1634 family transposase [Lepagella muris]THG45493.1 IS1634 family transposase [Bacteroidales bacterium]TKC54093.1 IS1634 family transposase [Bacteroidales bacterium]